MRIRIGFIIVLFVALLLFPLVANGQWRPAKRTKHYAERMNVFRKEGKLAVGKVIMFGDSHMEYGGNWNRFFDAGQLIVNRGIAGDDAMGMYHRLRMIIKAKPRAVFFDCGTNDLSYGLSVDEVFKDVVKVLEELHRRCPQTEIFVCSLLPLCPEKGVWKLMQGKEQLIQALNRKLKQYSMEKGFTFIDLYDKVVLPANRERMCPVFSRDGLHLSEAGYEVWARAMRRYLLTIALEGKV